MKVFADIICAFLFGGSLLCLLLVLSVAGTKDEIAKLANATIGGWILGALAVLGIMRFL